MSNLIFIEGISGVGKSTISTALCERLRSFNYSVDCYLEGDIDSPLDLFYVAYLTVYEYEKLLRSCSGWSDVLQKYSQVEKDYVLIRYQDTVRKYFSRELFEYLKSHELCFNNVNPVNITKFRQVFINRWKQFARNKTKNHEIYVFDGSLLHHQINDLIRYAATEDQIAAYLHELIMTVKALNPVVYYLTSRDVGSRLAAARQSRGQTPPTNEQTEFWQKRKLTDLNMLNKLPIESHIIDISSCNWDLALENIMLSITKGNI